MSGAWGLEHLLGRLQAQDIAVGPGAADDACGDAGDDRVPVQLIPGVDVGDVHLDNRAVEGLEGIKEGDGGEGERGRVDDDGVRLLPRLLHQIDQDALVIGLVESEGDACRPCEIPAACLDSRERGGAVDMRLAHPEQIEVRAVQDHQAGRHGGFLRYALNPGHGERWPGGKASKRRRAYELSTKSVKRYV